jgi:Fe-S oxidoreductase
MLRGEPIDRGWKSDAVKESLDYCLACKGCKHECPVNVDMATYKSEFLYHYFKGRIRPLNAWLFGYMFAWAKVASFAPAIANFFSQAPPFSTLLKGVAGIAPQRHVPLFADRTFRQWFEGREARNPQGQRVLLWTDTWNNHFHPRTAQAAVDVLEDAGFRVLIPPRQICCGRPLYDFGLLDEAKRHLVAIVDQLRPLIREGVPVVGLEPSCLSVFKDEMQNLLGQDLDAMRLAQQCYDFEAFINKKTSYRPPSLDRFAVVHEHCHKKAVLDPLAEEHVFDRMHLSHERLNSGCCGMAGAFGFEARHYEMSVACGERALLPKVRDAAPQTIVVADGFSCREQIAQCTGREAMHPAEVMRMGLADRGLDRNDPYPERRFAEDRDARRRRIVGRGYAALGAATAVALGIGAGVAVRRRR